MKRFLILMLITLSQIAFAEYEFVELGTLLKETGGSLQWSSLLQTGVLVCGKAHIVFAVDAPWIIVNSNYKIPTPGIHRDKGMLYFPKETAEQIKTVFQSKEIPVRVFRVGAIVIDPGHGGKDSGASYSYTVNGKTVRIAEKDIVLNLGQMLITMLTKRFPDKVVMLTREKDEAVPLEERPAVANSIPLKEDEAVIYISLHANASLSRSAKGFEVWYLTSTYKRNLVNTASVESEYRDIVPIINSMQEEEFTRESILLAKTIMTEIESAVGAETENRGLKEGEWLVVRKAKMPSILIELGFVSNREEAVKLSDQTYLQKLSLAIYNGVSSFIEKYEQSKGFTE
jgi:N-acetylmuramoyl-L-alanine amidase